MKKRNRKYKKVKAPKKVKLDSLPKIRRRLFKIWSEKVRERAGHRCEFCGKAKGEIGPNGNPINKIDAHHLNSRYVKDGPIKFEIKNGIGVCPGCHKFGTINFHDNPVNTMSWLLENHKDRFDYVLANTARKVDLDNRKVLEEIEARLLAGLSLDIDKLQQIEKDFPREVKKPAEETGNLFDEPTSCTSSS